MSDPAPPSLYEWAGGLPVFEQLTTLFYQKVRVDPLLQPVFQHMDAEHPHFVALFLAEVFNGPQRYSTERGGHPHMIARHLERHLTQEQRAQWVRLLLEAADEVELPNDPEFRSAFVAYLEWGSRLAVINSQPGVQPEAATPMPHWGWGEVGGPYRG